MTLTEIPSFSWQPSSMFWCVNRSRRRRSIPALIHRSWITFTHVKHGRRPHSFPSTIKAVSLFRSGYIFWSVPATAPPPFGHSLTVPLGGKFKSNIVLKLVFEVNNNCYLPLRQWFSRNISRSLTFVLRRGPSSARSFDLRPSALISETSSAKTLAACGNATVVSVDH